MNTNKNQTHHTDIIIQVKIPLILKTILTSCGFSMLKIVTSSLAVIQICRGMTYFQKEGAAKLYFRIRNLAFKWKLKFSALHWYCFQKNWWTGTAQKSQIKKLKLTRASPTGAGRSTFSYLILNCKQFTKLYILQTMMVI
jgi:hypothetical protein